MGILNCLSPSGPTLKEADALTAQHEKPVPGRYFFHPTVTFYKKIQLGELLIKEIREKKDAPFELSVAGINSSDGYRITSYRGRARIENGILLLLNEKCFVFASRSPETRLAPIRSWDCDHLIFSFRKNGQNYEMTKSPFPENTEWTGPIRLEHEPDGAYFSAQIMEKQNDGQFLIFGSDASRKLKKNQILEITENGIVAGRAEVTERYGDFIALKSLNSFEINPGKSLATTKTPPKKPGFFD